jgi:hypothetical protein
MSAIQTDAALLNEYDNAIESDDAFMDALFGKSDEDKDARNEPSENANEEDDESSNEERNDEDTNEDDDASEETPEDEDDEGGDDEDNEDDEDPKAKDKGSKKFADESDETYVKIKVGEEEHEVKVTDLKRLWGQEAALTRKSQEVSTAKTTYDEGQAKNIAAYNVLLHRSTERANEYRKLPWTQLMKDPDVDAGQLAALQAEAQKAFEDESFLKNEVDGFMRKVSDDQLKVRQEAARDALKAINDTASPHHIKGWTEALYNDIRSFATEQGVPAQMVNAITDPAAIKILHMAMQFKRGASKVVTKKVNKTPTKIVKNSASAPAARGSAKSTTAKQATAKAMKSGSVNDAIDAFEALFD